MDLHFRAVSSTKAGALFGFHQHANIPPIAHVIILHLYLTVRSARIRYLVVDRRLLLEFCIDDAETCTNRKPIVNPVANSRIDTKGRELRFLDVVTASPVIVIVKSETKVGTHAQAQFQIRIHAGYIVETRDRH